LIYNIHKNDNKIKLFGKEFVEKNKDNFILLVNNKILKNNEYFLIKKDINDKYIKFKFVEKNKITDMSYMFYSCKSLSSLPDISKWNTNNVNNMSYMFRDCKLLSSLPDISNWNTSNVNNMSYMFSNCGKLLSLPDISNWNTKNVNNMSSMFFN